MTRKRNPRRTALQQEDGFLLLGVLFMLLLITIALAVAAPRIAESIRRDKEIETMHRGMQYARAIRVFYAKYGRYPNTIDQLMKTDNQRFLRKKYLDPMTGKDDWRLIHLGEAKVPAMGLFGQQTQQTGLTANGMTSNGMANGTNGTSATSAGSFGSSSSSFGSPGSSGSSFGSSGSAFGSSGSSTSPIGGTDAGSGSGFGASTGAGGGGFGSSTGIGGTTPTGAGGTNNLNSPQTTGNSGAFGSPGVTVGGAPIVGVGLLSKKTSIKVYKKQTHYNQWEFVFDPTQNTLEATAGAATNVNGTNGASGSGLGSTNGSSNGSGLGSSTGSGIGSSSGSGFGSSSGSGFGSGTGSGFGSSNGNGFGGSPPAPVSPPVSNAPQ